jgi:serine/threonine protein kinase
MRYLIAALAVKDIGVENGQWDRGKEWDMLEGLQHGDPRSAGPYSLVGRLGVGGMGHVYLGRSPGGRLVAVKVIRPELAGDPGFRIRFAREVAVARNVSGLFTALVVDADTDGRQDPGGGMIITLTAPVHLYLQANNCHRVPDVGELTLSAAEYQLKQAGFSNIQYMYRCYGSPNIGDVVHQSPAPGSSYGSTQPVAINLQANNC